MAEGSPLQVTVSRSQSWNNANMSTSVVIHHVLEILLPSGGEIQVSVAAAVLVVVFYCFLHHLNNGGSVSNPSVSDVDPSHPTATATVANPLDGVRLCFFPTSMSPGFVEF